MVSGMASKEKDLGVDEVLSRYRDDQVSLTGEMERILKGREGLVSGREHVDYCVKKQVG